MQNMIYEAIDGLNMLFINDSYPVKPVEGHSLLDPDRVKSVTIIHQSTQSRVYLVTYKNDKDVIRSWWEGDRRGAFVVHNDTHYIDLTDDDYERIINAVDFIEMQQSSEEATERLLSASTPITLSAPNESKCIFKVFAHDYPSDDVTAEYELMNGLKEQLEGKHGTLEENCEQYIFECAYDQSVNPNVILIQTPTNPISHKRYRVLRGVVEQRETQEDIYNIFENTLANTGQDPIINQLFTIIHCIHSAGYYHRDIKPDNFVISGEVADRKIHLIDFGLTVRDTNLNDTDWQPATPDYLSPFMAHAKRYFNGLRVEDKKTLLIANDYWAIVCTIIYFMYSMSWRTHTLNGIALQDMPYLPVEMWLKPAVFNHRRVTGMSPIFREFLHIRDTVNEVTVEFKERPLGIRCKNSDNMDVFVTDIENDSHAERLGLERGWVMSKVAGKNVHGLVVDEVQSLLEKGKLPLTVVFLQGVVPESIDQAQNIRDAEDYISKIESITLQPPVSGGSKKYRKKKKTKRSFQTRKSRTRKPKTRKGRKTKKKRQKKRTKKKQRTRRK